MPSLTEKEKLDWKQKLKDACITVLEDRIQTAHQAKHEAQEAANEEEKSTVGDKYETARAMAQLNSEMATRQLLQAQQELTTLLALNISTICTQVTSGAVVVCKEETYFVAIGLGRTVIDGQKITLLSPQSPLAILMHLKKTGESVVFNGKAEEIVELY